MSGAYDLSALCDIFNIVTADAVRFPSMSREQRPAMGKEIRHNALM